MKYEAKPLQKGIPHRRSRECGAGWSMRSEDLWPILIRSNSRGLKIQINPPCNQRLINLIFVRMNKLYIIAGPNGAGKTTASYTILPEIFDCKEFVNADEIAKGISPFNQESVAIKAGKIMLQRIDELLENNVSFAFETTLSSKSYAPLIKEIQTKEYEVILLFLLLDSADLAVQRVKTRVAEGGHHIPEDVIRRRFEKGLNNLFNLYIPIVDKWILVNNSEEGFTIISEGTKDETVIKNQLIWNNLKQKYDGN